MIFVPSTPAADSNDEGDASLPSGEFIFTLARGVATVVTIAAFSLLMTFLIIARSLLLMIVELGGLTPLIFVVLGAISCFARYMGVPIQSLARVLIFLWAF